LPLAIHATAHWSRVRQRLRRNPISCCVAPECHLDLTGVQAGASLVTPHPTVTAYRPCRVGAGWFSPACSLGRRKRRPYTVTACRSWRLYNIWIPPACSRPTPPSLHAGYAVWVTVGFHRRTVAPTVGFHRRAVASRCGIHPSGDCTALITICLTLISCSIEGHAMTVWQMLSGYATNRPDHT
jgi:hypothetical protein